VQDTGIGIKHEQQMVIFQAFQQADGGSSRKYGGTGLGLSISRELTMMLGGEIQLESEPDQGSVFTLYLPLAVDVQKEQASIINERPQISLSIAHPIDPLIDDRDHISKSDKVMLIIEDDLKFANILSKKCH
jgi:hypothetical protein